MSAVTLPLEPALAPAPPAPSATAPSLAPGDPLALRLLRDEIGVDHELSVAGRASSLLLPLVVLTTCGFGAHAVTIAGMAWPSLGPTHALAHGGAWWAASTGGFFAAICAGLPSYWFHGVVAGIRAPAWRLAVELVRIQAVGSVVMAGILPFWLAGALGLHLVFGVDVYTSAGWMALTYALPFLCGTTGVFGLYRSFQRMRAARGQTGRLPALILMAWWVGLFAHTGPITIWALFHALTGN